MQFWTFTYNGFACIFQMNNTSVRYFFMLWALLRILFMFIHEVTMSCILTIPIYSINIVPVEKMVNNQWYYTYNCEYANTENTAFMSDITPSTYIYTYIYVCVCHEPVGSYLDSSAAEVLLHACQWLSVHKYTSKYLLYYQPVWLQLMQLGIGCPLICFPGLQVDNPDTIVNTLCIFVIILHQLNFRT